MKLFNGVVYRVLLIVFLVFVMLVAAIVVMMSKRGFDGDLSSKNTTPNPSERTALELVMTTGAPKTTKRFTQKAGDETQPRTKPIDTTLEETTTPPTTIKTTTESTTTSTESTTTITTTTTTPEPNTTPAPTIITTTPATTTMEPATSAMISEPTTTATMATTTTTKPTTTTMEPTTTTTPTTTTPTPTTTTKTPGPTTLTTTLETTTTSTPTNSSTEPTTTVPKIEKLVYAHVLFRTGTTRDEFYSDQMVFLETRLNQQGIDSSAMLGDFLKAKYVDTGFLKSSTADEIKWVSRLLKSCIETSDIVMSRMFGGRNKWKVKVDDSKSDRYGKNDFERPNGEKCKPAVSTFQSLYKGCRTTDFLCMLNRMGFLMVPFDEFQYAVYANKTGREVNGTDPEAAISYVSEFELYKNYFLNDLLFDVKYFDFIRPLLHDLRVAWDFYKMNEIRVKFNVFSTEDWVMIGILKAFNVFGHRFYRKLLIEWNSLIMIELWDIDGSGFVKFYLKRGEKSDENSIIEEIHNKPKGCENSDQKGCPIEIFLNSTGFEKTNMDEFCNFDPLDR